MREQDDIEDHERVQMSDDAVDPTAANLLLRKTMLLMAMRENRINSPDAPRPEIAYAS